MTGRLLRGLFEFTLIVVLLFFLASALGLLNDSKKSTNRSEDPWDPRRTEVLPAVVAEVIAPRETGDRSWPEGRALAGDDLGAGEVREKPLRLHVANGCGADGLAGRAREILSEAGFDVRAVSNADTRDYRETIVVDRSGDRARAETVVGYLQERGGVGRLVLQQRGAEPVDALVILGQDIAERLEGEAGIAPSP
ncbi:MAG: LytR C-terminal domain-containing protein [Candidatus Eisenbacteria bacterium]